MTERKKKILKLLTADYILSSFFVLVFVFSYPQTVGDVRILRDEINDKMQYEGKKLAPLLDYYSKISPVDARLLRVKSFLTQGNCEEALNNLLPLQKIAENDDRPGLFLQYQYLYALLYQSLGLNSEIKVNSLIKSYDSQTLQSLLDLTIDKSNFNLFTKSERVNILKSMVALSVKNGDVVNMIKGQVWLSQLLGDDNPQSITLRNSARRLLNKYNPGLYYDVLVYTDLSGIELRKNRPEAAFQWLKNFEDSALLLSNRELKAEYYRNLANAAAGTQDFQTLGKANDRYYRITQNADSHKTAARAILVNHVKLVTEQKIKVQQQIFRYVYIAVVMICITVILLIYWFKYRSWPKKQSPDSKEIKGYVIPDKTEKKLLEKLDAFEKSNKFIQKTVSVKTLAQQFDTNAKYLSEVINRHKNSNFNTYINNLRIDYIVDRLRHDPEYRKYKVSYLAEECGFSSHSMFATIFKNRMGLSPTEFLQKLNG